MRNKFEKQLITLNNELIEMGNLIEQAITMAISALVQQNITTAEEAIAFDHEINEQEKKIEALCLKLLLQQQPVARDLRLISAALKMITDMERIGDHAADISEITLLLAEESSIDLLEIIQSMAKETTDMVAKSIEAFVNRDLKLAHCVIAQDDTVDRQFMTLRQEIIKMINEKVEQGEQATDVLMVGKYFERIGDHATNIAEWVIFAITGQHNEA